MLRSKDRGWAHQQQRAEARTNPAIGAWKRVLAGFEHVTHAVTISRTPTKANYISTGWALNLSDGTEAGGDWHHARWFSMEDRQSHGPELFSGETVQVLAEQGIHDCRAALRRE